MTLQLDGWLAGRPYAVDRDPETGEALRYICLDCDGEIEADPDVFERHHCENYRDRSLDITPAAEALAEDEEIDLTSVEGSGKDGRITKADVASASQEE